MNSTRKLLTADSHDENLLPEYFEFKANFVSSPETKLIMSKGNYTVFVNKYG